MNGMRMMKKYEEVFSGFLKVKALSPGEQVMRCLTHGDETKGRFFGGFKRDPDLFLLNQSSSHSGKGDNENNMKAILVIFIAAMVMQSLVPGTSGKGSTIIIGHPGRGHKCECGGGGGGSSFSGGWGHSGMMGGFGGWGGYGRRR